MALVAIVAGYDHHLHNPSESHNPSLTPAHIWIQLAHMICAKITTIPSCWSSSTTSSWLRVSSQLIAIYSVRLCYVLVWWQLDPTIMMINDNHHRHPSTRGYNWLCSLSAIFVSWSGRVSGFIWNCPFVRVLLVLSLSVGLENLFIVKFAPTVT